MRAWVLAGLVGCAAGPASLPGGSSDAAPNTPAAATASSAAARTSHREEMLREATTTGLDVVFQGWLEVPSTTAAGTFSKDLGAASADTCLRIRVAAPALDGDAGSSSGAFTLTEYEGEQLRSTAFSLHDRWLAPHCVRRGTRVTVGAATPVEIVVVAAATFR